MTTFGASGRESLDVGLLDTVRRGMRMGRVRYLPISPLSWPRGRHWASGQSRGPVLAVMSWRPSIRVRLIRLLALGAVIGGCAEDEPTLVRFVNRTGLVIDSMFVTLPADALRYDSIAAEAATEYRRVARATTQPLVVVYRRNGESVAGAQGATPLGPGRYTFELTFTEHIVITLLP